MIKIYKFEVIIKLLVIFLLYYIVFFIKDNFKSSKLYRYFYREKNKKLFLKKILEANEEQEEDEDYLCKIEIFDVFSNKQMGDLIRSLNKLDNNKFKVKSYYRNKVIGDYSYVNAFNGLGGWGVIAEIIPKNEKHISKISIVKTQLNNKEIFVKFKIDLIPKEIDLFIQKNLKLIESWDIPSINGLDSSMYEREEQRCCFNLYQYYLKSILKLAYGKEYILPKIVYIYSKKLNLKELEEDDFSETYISKKSDNLIMRILIENDYNLYSISNKSFENIDILGYLNNELYYKFFSEIEKYEFTKRVNKYFSGVKKYIKYKDYLWLINKTKNLEDSDDERMKTDNHYSEEEEKLRDFIIGNGIQKEYFSKKYKNSYKYLSSIYSQQKEIFIIKIATRTLIATLVGIGITIYLSLITKS